jgi:hypothetical protein
MKAPPALGDIVEVRTTHWDGDRVFYRWHMLPVAEVQDGTFVVPMDGRWRVYQVDSDDWRVPEW